ncbi:hypothetical protein JZ751_013683 [Albula glossodonta]|uniref:Uncharacterized protein n=1 Tax=Albula glossodonta TaxID=121402 RepID=A0A8T2P4E1_9TELE|nr:hypothetical protein JZ751_013683 [Albula glossodonta]
MRALWIGGRCNSGARAGLFSWLLEAVRRPLKSHSRHLDTASQPDMRHHSQTASPAQAQTPPARATSTHPSHTTTTPPGITEPEDRPEQSKERPCVPGIGTSYMAAHALSAPPEGTPIHTRPTAQKPQHALHSTKPQCPTPPEPTIYTSHVSLVN